MTVADTLPLSAQGATIAFQGELGAFSHQACREAFPDMEPLPCASFEDAIAAVRNGNAALGMIPVENSIYGRVADVHHLLPSSGLYVIGEHFVRVRLNLLGVPGARLEDVAEAHSHTVALGQCRKFLKTHGLKAMTHADTAGSAASVAGWSDPSRAAIASTLAGEIYGLDVLSPDIEDATHNTTRFFIMSRRKIEADPGDDHVITSFVFRVRNVPAALYKAMGGFATNGVNMIKLESYMLDGSFTATQFFAEIDGHPESREVTLAMEELRFFTDYIKVLGVYPRGEARGR